MSKGDVTIVGFDGIARMHVTGYRILAKEGASAELIEKLCESEKQINIIEP